MAPSYLRPILWEVFKWKFKTLIFCLVLSAGSQSLGLMMPHMEGRMTDSIISAMTARDNGARGAALQSLQDTVWDAFAMVVTAQVASGVISILFDNIDSRTDVFLGLNVKNYVLHRVIGQDMSFFTHSMCEKTRLRARIDHDSKQFPYLIHHWPFTAFNTVWSLGVTAYMLIAVMHVPAKLMLIGFAAQPFVAILTWLVSDYTRVMAQKASALVARIESASLDILLNVEYIKVVQAQAEAITARIREQYAMYDLQCEMLTMTSIIQMNILSWTTLTDLAVMIIGLQACMNGEMTWGNFIAFRTYLRMVQGRANKVLQLFITYSKSVGVASNLARMVSTPVEWEKRVVSYSTKRPRFNQGTRIKGSAAADALYAVVMAKQGYRLRSDHIDVERLYKDFAAERALSSIGTKLTADSGILAHPRAWSVSLKNVCFRYTQFLDNKEAKEVYVLPRVMAPDRPTIIQNLSFDIKAGTIALIVGPNGCGKSSTMGLLTRLWVPESGTVEIDGKDLRTGWTDSDALRSGINMHVQETPLLAGDFLSNILAGRGGDTIPATTRDQFKAALHRWMQAHQFPTTSFNLDQKTAGGTDKKASGGQNQKVGLIRTLAFERSLLILDEPLNHLDFISRAWFVNFLIQLKETHERDPTSYMPTIIIISHDNALADVADQIIVMVPPEVDRVLSATKLEKRYWGAIAGYIHKHRVPETEFVRAAEAVVKTRKAMETKLADLNIPDRLWTQVCDMLTQQEVYESSWTDAAKNFMEKRITSKLFRARLPPWLMRIIVRRIMDQGLQKSNLRHFVLFGLSAMADEKKWHPIAQAVAMEQNQVTFHVHVRLTVCVQCVRFIKEQKIDMPEDKKAQLVAELLSTCKSEKEWLAAVNKKLGRDKPTGPRTAAEDVPDLMTGTAPPSAATTAAAPS